MTTGQLYRQFKEIIQISYAKFHEIIMKLEHLKLIDTAYRKGRGKTRVVIKKYDSKLVWMR